jgi:hypothetical protein
MPPQGSPPDLQVGVRCRFCGDAAVVGAYLPRGCVCHPADLYQALCYHHFLRATPLGGLDIIVDFTAEQVFLNGNRAVHFS